MHGDELRQVLTEFVGDECAGVNASRRCRRPTRAGIVFRMSPLVDHARSTVLETGVGLDEAGILDVLTSPDHSLPELLALAHDVRMRWCGPEVEVEGIVSVKTGGCPEDCHFCSQSGQFSSPVRAVWLDIAQLVEAARQTAATGATEFCIVAAVRGPDERLMAQMRDGVAAIKAAVDINVAASLGMLTQDQVDELAAIGVHRYNHNLETARSFFPQVVTTHTWQERWDTLRMVRDAGMEVCCGGIPSALGETVEQRAEFATQPAELGPHEVPPLNFLNPRPGTPLADRGVLDAKDALRGDRRLPTRPPAHDPPLRRRAGNNARRPPAHAMACSVASTRSSWGTTSPHWADRRARTQRCWPNCPCRSKALSATL